MAASIKWGFRTHCVDTKTVAWIFDLHLFYFYMVPIENDWKWYILLRPPIYDIGRTSCVFTTVADVLAPSHQQPSHWLHFEDIVLWSIRCNIDVIKHSLRVEVRSTFQYFLCILWRRAESDDTFVCHWDPRRQFFTIAIRIRGWYIATYTSNGVILLLTTINYCVRQAAWPESDNQI